MHTHMHTPIPTPPTLVAPGDPHTPRRARLCLVFTLTNLLSLSNFACCCRILWHDASRPQCMKETLPSDGLTNSLSPHWLFHLTELLSVSIICIEFCLSVLI